jgi:hypothetical protein
VRLSSAIAYLLNPGFGLDHLSLSKTLPDIPSAEMKVTKFTPGMPLPLLDDRRHIPTRPFSLTSSHPSGFGDQNSSPTPVAIREPTEDSRIDSTSFEKMIIDLSRPLSNQAHGLHTSGTHLRYSTSNDFNLLDTNFTPNKETQSNFRLGRQGHQFSATGFTSPPSRFLADRDRKKYWCQPCEIGFSQKQGINRHNKDRHLRRNLCPYCREFEWSPGRHDKWDAHLEKNHPDAAAPKVLKFQP